MQRGSSYLLWMNKGSFLILTYEFVHVVDDEKWVAVDESSRTVRSRDPCDKVVTLSRCHQHLNYF